MTKFSDRFNLQTIKYKVNNAWKNVSFTNQKCCDFIIFGVKQGKQLLKQV